MKTFNKNIQEIMLEFKRYDQLHHKFFLDFESEIYSFTTDYPEIILAHNDFPKDLKSFTVSLINCAYEVLEKDASYAEYRIETELENMNLLLERYPLPIDHESFSKGFIKISKTKLPLHFPQLFDLTANGFRLLERSISYRINAFLMHLYNHNSRKLVR